MKQFSTMELAEAIAHAREGGQALHLHKIIANSNAPRCFVNAVRRGHNIAHLFDQDLARLRKTASRLGVRIIVIERIGTPKQHIDLCGSPLNKALAMCEPTETESA